MPKLPDLSTANSGCCSADPAASSCGCAGPAEKPAASCCGGGGESTCCGGGGRIDWLMWGSLVLVAAGIAGHFLGTGPGWWRTFAHGSWDMMSKAWWGILVGIAAVGVLGQVPKEVVAKLLGKGGTLGGIVRATLAGTLLDLCNHGILMVGMQLYRKGASLGQTIAFLVSSPWNSLSLTLILIGLIGLKWTLAFVALSMLIGIVAGRLADFFVKRGVLPENEHRIDMIAGYRLKDGLKEAWAGVRPGDGNLRRIVKDGLGESKMVLRWIFFGIAMAAAIRAFVPTDIFSHYFGPSLIGLLLTLVATTIIEVCSEGSSPIAADLLTRAGAPGNAFTFLMAGAATDYTEIMALRETTKSWKATLALPFITTPQVLVVAWLLNHFGA
ncbi:permease [Haloferula sargassicola]